MGGRAVGRDPVHPGGEAGVAPEALQALEGPEVGVLGDVSGVVLVPGEPVGQRVDLCLAEADQLGEGIDVAGLGPFHEGSLFRWNHRNYDLGGIGKVTDRLVEPIAAVFDLGVLDPSSTVRLTDSLGSSASGSPGGSCASGPSGSTS